MSTSLVPVKLPPKESQFALTEAQTILHRMVMDSVQSIVSKSNYAKALDDLCRFPLLVACHIIWHTSELIIWHPGSGSEVRMSEHPNILPKYQALDAPRHERWARLN
jgi:hypothetical protein